MQAVTPAAPRPRLASRAAAETRPSYVGGQRIQAGGDVITAIDGKTVNSMTDVINDISTKQPGDSVQLTLVNGSQKRTVTVTLADRPASVKQ